MAIPFIYLIDDDEDDREIFGMAVKNAIPTALCNAYCNGTKALNALNNSQKPDYIFIDLNMPLMSGREVLLKIRECPTLQGVNTIVYTTSSNPADVEELKNLGATHYFVKPNSLNTLIFVLRELFSGAALPYLINGST